MKNKRRSFKKIDFIKKEREPLEPLFKKQALITALSVLLVVLITLTGSFAIFTKTSEGNEYNVVQVGELELSYVDLNDEGNVLQLADSYPISDTDGEASTPYRFSVENTGTIIADYTVKIVDDTDTIEADGCSDNLLDNTYIRYKFDNETSQNLIDKKDATSNEYVIYSGTLEPFESNIHEIRLWINENSPNSILGTHYHGKVVIEVTQNNATDPYERPVKPTLADMFKDKVQESTSTFPNFAQISSATNGRGIYKYQEDGEDIYYWRGNIDAVATEENGIGNHVIFGGFCWEMVRTTKTGGVKMIYDGVPVESNGVQTCPNTGSNSQLSVGDIAFNTSYDDNAYVGYMYGLTGVTAEPASAQCIKLNSAGTQAEIGTETTESECTANGGKWATTAHESTHANVVNSTIKTTIDTWFATSGLNTEENLEKLEDAVYCNDRRIDTVSGYGNGLGYGTNQTAYMARNRFYTNKTTSTPDLSCEKNDSFTVNSENGNGDLTYPVGLLTADEIVLAGGLYGSNNTDYYLNVGSSNYYWALSPFYFNGSRAYEFLVRNSGSLNYRHVDDTYGVRPVVSLVTGTEITGLGTANSPFEVK